MRPECLVRKLHRSVHCIFRHRLQGSDFSTTLVPNPTDLPSPRPTTRRRMKHVLDTPRRRGTGYRTPESTRSTSLTRRAPLPFYGSLTSWRSNSVCDATRSPSPPRRTAPHPSDTGVTSSWVPTVVRGESEKESLLGNSLVGSHP